MVKRIFLFYFFFFAFAGYSQVITGKVFEDKEPLVGVAVLEVGTKNATVTDFNGAFEITLQGTFPVQLEVSFVGYTTQIIKVSKSGAIPNIIMKPDNQVLGEVSVVEQRLSEKQKESALTVEAMDLLAIKETPSVNFYEGLGNLKGVDLTSASIGFKVINTRGFNSTSPVRSLQLIDGVDNQAPGLNFSLGNFLGASELDLLNVDIIAGASSAFYGPGAFNGVIDMKTKNPFDFQGLTLSVKGGERALFEIAGRYAKAFKVGNSDFENFAFKINTFYLRANDWEATNYNPIYNGAVPADNPGRFDAINIYGDEDLGGGNNYDEFPNVLDMPGLGKFYRQGYTESDLVDYNTKNYKQNIGLYWRPQKELQVSYNFNYGTGTTVYQGENRFSLKNIHFFQNVVEVKKDNKFYVRAYATNENAGDSYDAVLTAFKMNTEIGNINDWNRQYYNLWRTLNYDDSTWALTGFPMGDVEDWFNGPYQDSIKKYNSKLSGWHENVLNQMNEVSYPRPEPGTPEYEELFNKVTSKTFEQGGSKFYDKSALYHVMGEYQFHPSWADIRIGGNFRHYRPNSRGNIFDEKVISTTLDSNGNNVNEISFRQITNNEFGFFGGIEKKLLSKRLVTSLTLRVDKNENFDYNFSPALSVSYDINEFHKVRVSFSSAIRNPTLQDQYLRYDVGRAILLGNLNGYDSLVTLNSFNDFRDSQNKTDLSYFDVDPISPERVQTIEFGYRSTWFERLFVDMNYYHNWYTNFIGFQFGLDIEFAPSSNQIQYLQAYRVSANSSSLVTTQGASVGLNYYLDNHLSINGNYTWNILDLTNNEDEIIPAFNSPEHKFNIGLTGRNYYLKGNKEEILGFNLVYKWVQGFLFEGSPQFTGFIEDYGLLDAQVSYQRKQWNMTYKLGASNLLNNRVYQVYGGPEIGRLIYASVLFELF